MSDWKAMEREAERFRRDIRALPVTAPSDPLALRRRLETRYNFAAPHSLCDLTEDVSALLRDHTVHVTHPCYFGLFNPSVRDAGIVADFLAALYNPQLAAWSHAPAACEIERLTLRHLGSLIGFDTETLSASFTTGGAEANLCAVLAALAHYGSEAGYDGVAALPARPAIYVSGESHHSFVKIARMTGLGTDALRAVATTPQYTMDPEDLAARILSDRTEGWKPLLIVGTAGTTSSGAVDPLVALADIAGEADLWFHVDAAWAGAVVLSPRLRPVLAGIGRADSVTWDAHKWLSVPMGAGMFFCRHPRAVRNAFAASTSYMPDAVLGGAEDPYTTSVQWSRRAIGLKVFMALAELGDSGYAELIEHQAAMGDLLRAKLRSAGWLVVNQEILPVICFTHDRIRCGQRSTHDLLQTLYARGRAWISDVVLGGNERVLRACITSYHTTPADIDVLLAELNYALQ